jgi:hypothetical protein
MDNGTVKGGLLSFIVAGTLGWWKLVREPDQVPVVTTAVAAAHVVLDLSPSAQALTTGCADLLSLRESDSGVAPGVWCVTASTCLASCALGGKTIQK